MFRMLWHRIWSSATRDILGRSMKLQRIISTVLMTLMVTAPGRAAEKDEKPAGEKKADDLLDLPPLPADKTVKQTARIGGEQLHYEATVGTIPVRDDKGRVIGDVVYTAYVVPGRGPRRPVTFAFNGGPGASSVYLNMGAIGPKRIKFGAQGDVPSDAPITTDNANSWLDFTDLVFIDSIGTGFSRSRLVPDKTKKAFYANDPDIKYLSRVAYDWLVKAERLRSPKYVIGESYGGYPAPPIALEIQSQIRGGRKRLVIGLPHLGPASGQHPTS